MSLFISLLHIILYYAKVMIVEDKKNKSERVDSPLHDTLTIEYCISRNFKQDGYNLVTYVD